MNTATSNGAGIYCEGKIFLEDDPNDPYDPTLCTTIPSFINCNIRGNYSFKGGGVYIINYANPQFFNCNISENHSIYGGGGIRISVRCFPYFENCTITGNYSLGSGEAIHVGLQSGHDFIFCTIAENGDGTGSAIYFNYHINLGTYKECIIWNSNTQYEINGNIYNDPNYYQIYFTPPIVTYSNIRDPNGYDGEGNINSDPLFVDPNAGDYHQGDIIKFN